MAAIQPPLDPHATWRGIEGDARARCGDGRPTMDCKIHGSVVVRVGDAPRRPGGARDVRAQPFRRRGRGQPAAAHAWFAAVAAAGLG